MASHHVKSANAEAEKEMSKYQKLEKVSRLQRNTVAVSFPHSLPPSPLPCSLLTSLRLSLCAALLRSARARTVWCTRRATG